MVTTQYMPMLVASKISWRKYFFGGLQSYMENKSEGNENKITLRDFNCTLDKTDGEFGNKTQRIYRCGFIYVLSKLFVNNRLEDLWRRKNPDSSQFTHYKPE